MRKLVLLAGLLMAASFLPAAPAKADALLGCECVRLGGPAMCVPTVLQCNFQYGGVCVGPCSYEQPKAGKKHHGKKKMHRGKKKKK